MSRMSMALCLLLSSSTLLGAPPRGVNRLANPSFEQTDGSVASGWNTVGDPYDLAPGRQPGQRAMHFRCDTAQASRGAVQEILFDPPLKHPFLVSGWSKSQAVQGQDYCLYLDVWYADGTNLWGQRGDFQQGTHDWQCLEYVFDVAKPVTKIQCFVLFRNCVGEAWF